MTEPLEIVGSDNRTLYDIYEILQDIIALGPIPKPAGALASSPIPAGSGLPTSEVVGSAPNQKSLTDIYNALAELKSQLQGD